MKLQSLKAVAIGYTLLADAAFSREALTPSVAVLWANEQSRYEASIRCGGLMMALAAATSKTATAEQKRRDQLRWERFLKLGYFLNGVDPTTNRSAQEEVNQAFMTTFRTYLSRYQNPSSALAPHFDEDLVACAAIGGALKKLEDE